VALLSTKVVSSKATSKSAEQTSVLLSHRRSIGVVVRSIRICGLLGKLVVLSLISGVLTLLLLWLLAALAHLLLICLVSSEGVVLSRLLLLLVLLLTWIAAIVACVTLRVRGIIGTVLPTSLAVLEAALLGWTERVGSVGWAEVLRIVATLLLTTVLWLLGIPLRIVVIAAVSSLVVALLRVLPALVVWIRHLSRVYGL